MEARRQEGTEEDLSDLSPQPLGRSRWRRLPVTRKWASVFLLMCGAVLTNGAAAKFPVFHGDDTALRKLVSHIRDSRISDGYLWTYGDLAVLVQLYPAPIDFRAEDVPFRGHVPWRPAWIEGWPIREQLTKTEQNTFVMSKVAMILREEDGTTCVVNELSGKRIFKEKAGEQDGTAVEMPCEKIWSQFETLGELPEPAKLEISELLRTPPAAPKFKRKARVEPQESKSARRLREPAASGSARLATMEARRQEGTEEDLSDLSPSPSPPMRAAQGPGVLSMAGAASGP